MRELLLEFYIIKIQVIDYLCLLLTLACVKMSISWRKYAWVSINYSTHQRLNKEYLNNNKNNRIWFEQSPHQNNYSPENNSSPENNNGTVKLHPQYVTGFSDAESTFYLNVTKISTNKTGLHLKPGFKIELYIRDVLILKSIHSFFGVGNLRSLYTKNRNPVAIYCVESINDLANVIIPHFDKYPLLSKKRVDFELLKKIVMEMRNKQHLTIDGINKILCIRASLNKGLSPSISKHFPNVVPVEIPKVEVAKTFDPFWILGFVEGEGCFYVKISNYATNKYIISLKFILSQHARDHFLMNSLIKYLGCGRLEETPIISRLVITKFEDIQQIVIPFFSKYPLIGSKKHDLSDWLRVAELMKNKAHLTKEGIDEINSIKLKMNSGRESSDLANLDNLYSPSNSDDMFTEVPVGLTGTSYEVPASESENKPRRR